LNKDTTLAQTEICEGRFDSIHGSHTNPGNYQRNGWNRITIMSQNPSKFKVLPGKPGSFAVPGAGCDPNSYYVATAQVRVDFPDGQSGFMSPNPQSAISVPVKC
ncbi:14113_t:CDS:2, partial [Ambispora leptoticha]